MNWKVGDCFYFVRGAPGTGGGTGRHKWLIGTTGTVLATSAQTPGYFTVSADLLPYPHHDDWCGWSVHPSCLRRIPDDKHKRFHEALNKTEWSDCEFNPMVEIER